MFPEWDLPCANEHRPKGQRRYSQAVFRETFLQELVKPEPIAAFREFAKHLSSMISEGYPVWRGTPVDARAEELRAVAADLTYLTKHLKVIGFLDKSADDEGLITPRDNRWTRYALRLGKRLETIVRDIEAELNAGLEEADNFPGQH